MPPVVDFVGRAALERHVRTRPVVPAAEEGVLGVRRLVAAFFFRGRPRRAPGSGGGPAGTKSKAVTSHRTARSGRRAEPVAAEAARRGRHWLTLLRLGHLLSRGRGHDANEGTISRVIPPRHDNPLPGLRARPLPKGEVHAQDLEVDSDQLDKTWEDGLSGNDASIGV
jgi:hypothetical protein